MRKFISLFFLCIICGLVLLGCTPENEEGLEMKHNTDINNSNKNDEENSNGSQEPNDKSRIDILPLPSTYEELSARPKGEYSELKYGDVSKLSIKELLEMFKDFPNLSKEPTEQELDIYYQEILRKVQREYKGPEEAIRQLRFQSIGDPNMEDSRYQFKENLNVEIILDASGSMAGSVNGKVKMDAAKTSILNFVKQLPKEARVGIRVYGHKGSNADSDKDLSCGSSDIVYPISAYEESKFQSALNQIKPVGWTPIGLALKEAQKDLSQFDGKTNTNIVYLVSDGISTCDDNPIQAAKDLYNSNIKPIVNVIGFDVDSNGQNQLREIANTTEGIYANVADENELTSELSKLNQVAEMWEEWKKKGLQSLDSKKVRNSLDIFSYSTKEYVKCTDEDWVIDGIIYKLRDNNLINRESSIYLEQKNQSYHNWIDSEIEKLDAELKDLNEKTYVEALKALEDKYKQNTQ